MIMAQDFPPPRQRTQRRQQMVSRRQVLQAGVGLVGAALLGSCTSSPSVPTPETVRVAGSTFGFPSPFAYIAGPGYVQMSMLYDTLLWKDRTGRLQPWLADGYERSPDGLTYTFHLRDGIRWHDGLPLTAADVAFTFSYFGARPFGPLLVAQPFGVDGAKAVSRDVVEVHLQLPAVTFLEAVAGAVPIVPKHVWSDIADAPQAQDLEVLVGSGPYRLESFSRVEGSLLYTANSEYFLGKPAVTRLELLPADDELTALQAGEIDLAATPIEGVRPDALESFRDDDAFGIVESTGGFTFPFVFNARRGGALADPRFRQACAYAIDRTSLIGRLLGGNGAPGNVGFLPPGHPFRVPVEQYPFDIETANRMLDEAGYLAPEPGALRQSSKGEQLSFEIVTGNAPVPPVLPLLVDALRQVGVELKPTSVDLPTLFGRFADGDDDIALSLYPGPGGTAPDADPDTLRTFYSSAVPNRLQGAQGWADAEFDRLASEQLITTDRSERANLLAQMQTIVARDVPAIPLYYPTLYSVFRKSVFDRWYYTPGGFASGLPGVLNKQALIAG